MGAELSLWQLFSNASLLVKLVMLGLLVLSIISWAVMIQRFLELREAKSEMGSFEDQFWSGADLSRLFDVISARDDIDGLSHIFQAGFKEYIRMNKHPELPAEVKLESTSRAMTIAVTKECDKLEENLSLLATVGSVSPYIGLFGTVWGIMHAIIALGSVEHATLSMVAPGIAEALVATAMGLFVAIPAFIAYNRIGRRVEVLQNKFVTFQEEFLGILHRQVHLK